MCMTAVSGLAVSVGSGSIAVGSVVVFGAAASAVYAFDGPYSDYSPAEYVSGNEYTSGHIELNAGGNDVDIIAGTATDIKITLSGSNATANPSQTITGSIASQTVWLTSSGNGTFYRNLDPSAITRDVKQIYVNGGALGFNKETNLNTSFVIGASTYADNGKPAVNNSALMVTGGNVRASIGALTVQENSKIGLRGNGSSLTVNGALSGSGNLDVASISDGPGSLYLMGGTDGYTGKIVLNVNGNRSNLYLGADTELGGLSSQNSNNTESQVLSAADFPIKLTLNVKEGEDISLSAQINNGIEVVKRGLGTQRFSRFGGDSLDVQAGKVVLTGTVTGLKKAIKVSSGATLDLGNGADLAFDISGMDREIEIIPTLGTTTDLKMSVRLVDPDEEATVLNWDHVTLTSVTEGASLTLNNDYTATMTVSGLIVRRTGGELFWENHHDFEKSTVWEDGSSFAVMLDGGTSTNQKSVTLVTGTDIKDNASGAIPEADMASYNRSANTIYVDANSELVLRQARNFYVAGNPGHVTWQHVGSVSWNSMILEGTLVLKDKNVLGQYTNPIVYGPNSKVIIDWRYEAPPVGDTDLSGYNVPGNSSFVGNYNNLPASYRGDLIIRTGVFNLTGMSGAYKSLTLEAGANLALTSGVYDGDISISGTGVTGALGNTEASTSAFKLGNLTTVGGNLTINNSASVLIWATERSTVRGNLIGEGAGHVTLMRGANASTRFDAQALWTVEGSVKGIKEFTIDKYATLAINSTFDAADIDEATAQSRHFQHMNGGGTIEFFGGFVGFDHVTVNSGDEIIIHESGYLDEELTQFVKDGTGDLRIACDLVVDGRISVDAGILQFGDGPDNHSLLEADEIYVHDGAGFVISHAGASTNAKLILNNSTLSNISTMAPTAEELQPFHFSALELKGGSSFLNWAGGTANEGFSFDVVTGDAHLVVEDMDNDATSAQILQMDEIRNFNGTISVAILNRNNLRDNKKVIVGTIHQDYGNSGYIVMDDTTDYDQGHVTSYGFRKTGEGYFNINSIRFVDEVWMNYDGSLDLGKVTFADKTTLHYLTGDKNRVIKVSGLESDSSVTTLYIDVLSLSAETLRQGVNLGFANSRDVTPIERKLRFVGLESLSGKDLVLQVIDGYVHLIANLNMAELAWDSSWGISDILNAPSKDDLKSKIYRGSLSGTGSYSDAMLELSDPDSNKWSVTKNGQVLSLVKITAGGGELATVLGGAYYSEAASTDPNSAERLATQRIYTYIMMDGEEGTHYHLLVGGASNQSTAATNAYGHVGNSHIQVEAGSVDYLVGGNHISSGGFIFRGDSSISVMEGATLNGGIVGGSTYTTSAGTDGFIGDSHIFIYTPLVSPKNVPTISSHVDEVDQAAFTAVIGGSAVAGYDSVNPSLGFNFIGDSFITVDLTEYSGSGKLFDKDIVGGNGYYTTSEIFADGWSSTFEGDSSIVIQTKDKTTGITFSGNISGASSLVISDLDQPAAAPSVQFLGDTSLKISGGKYTGAVAGGFYNELSDNFAVNSVLEGSTQVGVSAGAFWRISGGSYSAGGDEGSTMLHDGSSNVEVLGGSFTASDKNGLSSLIVGGDIAESEAGSHVQSGEARVTVVGSTLTNGAIVGGHYAHDGAGVEFSIDGGTVVTVEQSTVTGMLVGGNYLNAGAAQGSSVVSGGSQLTIGARATVKPGGDLVFGGVAAVAGSVLVDCGSMTTAVTEDGSLLKMEGGTVNGHIVGGSAAVGGLTELVADMTGVSISGGTVTGNVYGGHYASWDSTAKVSEQPRSEVGDVVVTVSGEARIVGNLIGGLHAAGSDGTAGNVTERRHTQGSVTVQLQGGSMSGDVYAAGEIGAGASVSTNGEVRVELSSDFTFTGSKTTVSGDYRKLEGFEGGAYVESPRVLAFTDDHAYDATKKWSGVTFRDFDMIDVAEGGDIHLAASQFVAATDLGDRAYFTKAGAGKLTLDSNVNGQICVDDGILAFTKKQDISRGLRFDLTGRTNNDAASAFLQSSAGYTLNPSPCDVSFAGDLDSVGWGKYYLASGIDWNTFSLDDFRGIDGTDRREFRLAQEGDCLVLRVLERSDNPWLWRGDTENPKVAAMHWDKFSAANWNEDMMNPGSKETPEGKDLLFTASAEGEVLVGERVNPNSVTVESGHYIFTQRSEDIEKDFYDGILVNAIYVGGGESPALLELRLNNQNIANLVLYENGEVIASYRHSITSPLRFDDSDTDIYFDGGIFSYAENFNRDVSGQVRLESTGMVRVGVYLSDNPDAPVNEGIVWDAGLYSLGTETWSANSGFTIALTHGIEKVGDGRLRLNWKDARQQLEFNDEYYETPIYVQGGQLELLINGDKSPSSSAQSVTGSPNALNFALLYFTKGWYVAEGAEVDLFIQRDGMITFEEGASFSGSGTVVLGRQLGDEPSLNKMGLWVQFPNNPPGQAWVGVQAPYVVKASNMDFAGTIVLEGVATPGKDGDAGLRAENYFVIEATQADTNNPSVGNSIREGYVDYASYDSDTQTLNALGGGSTKLVLAGRHLSVHGYKAVLLGDNQAGPVGHTSGQNAAGQKYYIDEARYLWLDKYVRAGEVEVREGTLNYVGATWMEYTNDTYWYVEDYRAQDNAFVFTGKITGSGTLAIPYSGYGHTLMGPVNEFTGTFVAGDLNSRRPDNNNNGSPAVWLFDASSASGDVTTKSVVPAQLAGNGTMIFMYTRDTVLEGQIGDTTMGFGNNTDIANMGEGKLTLGSSKNTSDGVLHCYKGGIWLGDEDHYAFWNSNILSGDSTFTFVNGYINRPFEQVEGASVTLRVETSDRGPTKVNAGGTEAADFSYIIMNAGGYLEGVKGDILASPDQTYVKLVFNEDTVGTTAEGQHMIKLAAGHKLIVEDPNFFLLDFTTAGLVELLSKNTQNEMENYLHILERGTIELDRDMWKHVLADGGEGARLLALIGFYVERVEKGDIVLLGSANRVYRVFSDSNVTDDHYVTQYNVLTDYSAVLVEKGQTLYINISGEPGAGTKDDLAGGCRVPNLIGDLGSAVVVTNTDAYRGVVTVIFDNEDDEGNGFDTTFNGQITGGADVAFVKDGAGKLTVGFGDGYSVSGGFTGDSLEIRQGSLVLRGDVNSFDVLTFNYRDALQEEEERGLTLLYGETTVGQVVESGIYGTSGPITLGQEATLTLTGESTWQDIVVKRESEKSNGTLIVQGSVEMKSQEVAQLDGVHLKLDGVNSLVQLNGVEGNTVASLSGSGVLSGAETGTLLTVTNERDALFTGTLSSINGGQNTLLFKNGEGEATLRNVKNAGELRWNLYNEGKLTLDVSGKFSDVKDSNNMYFNQIELRKDSVTHYVINTDRLTGTQLTDMIYANGLMVEAGAQMTVSSTGSRLYTGTELTIAQFGSVTNPENLADVSLSGLPFARSKVTGVTFGPNGAMKLLLDVDNTNRFLHNNQHTNAQGGASLVFGMLDPDSKFHNLSESEKVDLVNMYNGIDALRLEAERTGDYTAHDKALAAVAGASVTTLGPALAQDLQRQLNAIRNRTTTMGNNPNYVDANGPVYHVWINGEGNYHKLESDGLAPGFTLSSWGGTVGMDVDISERSSVGVALTAMYGSLTADAPDKAEGKLDTYYLSLFGRLSRGNWSHTLVGSIGLANVSLDRTVNYGSGSYKTDGSTNGYAFGLMYELGYSIPMDDESSYVLQPLVNLSFRHTSISGYEENGGAGLQVGDITQSIVSLGAGVRLQAAVGENSLNQTSIFEARLLAKIDSGDINGEGETALKNGSPSAKAQLKAAEVGGVGAEFGAGLTVPLEGQNGGAVFLDGSMEIRSGYMNMNATIGYRIGF